MAENQWISICLYHPTLLGVTFHPTYNDRRAHLWGWVKFRKFPNERTATYNPPLFGEGNVRCWLNQPHLKNMRKSNWIISPSK